MKTSDVRRPVMASWLYDQGYRLDPSPFLSDAVQASAVISDLSLPKQKLSTLTGGRIFHPGRIRRRWATDPDYGVPFLSTTDILKVDFSRLRLISRNSVAENPQLILGKDWTLITRSGSIGRMTYARRTMEGMACTEHVMRVVPDPEQVLPGYIYAFLSSRYGRALVARLTYGTIVQHIEPRHIADLEVPRLGREREEQVHALIEEASEERAKFQEDVEAATGDLLDSAGLSNLGQLRWHDQLRDLGFTVTSSSPRTLRALNYSPQYRDIVESIQAVPHSTLDQICADGQLRTGPQFKRIDSDSTHGVRLIGPRQAFWLRPEGPYISIRYTPREAFVEDETVLIAAHRGLGENGIYGQAMLVTGEWVKNVYSKDFLRIESRDDRFPGAYLFAFLRSSAALRCFQSMRVGSMQQEFNLGLAAEFPVPMCAEADRNRIAEKMRRAYRRRDEADRMEDDAVEIVERAVAGGGLVRSYEKLEAAYWDSGHSLVDTGSKASWLLDGVTQVFAASQYEWFVLVLLPISRSCPSSEVSPGRRVVRSGLD